MDGSPHGEAAAGLAIGWAQRFGSQLVGLGVLDEPTITRPQPVSFGATSFKRERDETLLARAHDRVREFLELFRDRCEAASVPCAIVEDVGMPHEQIVLETTACDAVVLGKETHFHLETQDTPDETLSRVLRRSPRPVIIVPRDSTDGEGVLVAYGYGQEIVRTLQTFTLLGLAGAEMVVVLSVAPDGATVAPRLRRAGEYLAAHGVSHRLRPVISDAQPAEVILEEVRRRRPRLLVMGAHGHHPVRELFFTSVTRAVLKEAPVPVFAGS